MQSASNKVNWSTSEKKALLNYKNIEFPQLPNYIFQRNWPMILGKDWNFPFFLFLNKMGFEIMFADYRVRKQAILH